jgi:hypothetical protein
MPESTLRTISIADQSGVDLGVGCRARLEADPILGQNKI